MKCGVECKQNRLLEPSHEDHTDFEMRKTSKYTKDEHAICCLNFYRFNVMTHCVHNAYTLYIKALSNMYKHVEFKYRPIIDYIVL